MAFLHAQNIVHRDLACRNLLATRNLRSELTIKITDFGMSRFNKADGPQSEAQQQSGPLKWMAPEGALCD
jgi:serine/threonine protein kinase